ncbi:hypothetical protein MIMGU_mgv1a023140mg, partial [Erythranthe guttata]
MDSFNEWIELEKNDLDELVTAYSFSNDNNNSNNSDDERLKRLVEKGINHFEEYCKKRGEIIMDQNDIYDATSFMCPVWGNSFGNAFLWFGGCRPSLFIRLVYSVGGSEFDQHLSDQLHTRRGGDGIITRGNLADISGQQLHMVNALHCRTMKEEHKISSKMATLQEQIADKPLAVIAKNAEPVGEWSEEVERAMKAHSVSLGGILAEADRLRLSTFKELMAILTPPQAVDLLIATKKLHISMR